MIKKISAILTINFFLFIIVTPAFCQISDVGFFLMIENKANCTHRVNALMGVTTYCLPDAPVIAKTDFEFVGDVKYNEKSNKEYINLRLSPVGFETLQTLAARLPNTKLALVIEDKVVGIFETLGNIVDPTIPVIGAKDSPEMQWIYEKVKKTRQ